MLGCGVGIIKAQLLGGQVNPFLTTLAWGLLLLSLLLLLLTALLLLLLPLFRRWSPEPPGW
jgi:hypothetical protein